MPHLAFYRAQSGSLNDRVISWVTRSPFSHVEFIPDAPETRAISASGRDGGVRWKAITFRPERWEILPVPWAPPDAADRIAEHIDAPYDWAGLLMSQALNLRRQSDRRWFCSEICAYALGMDMPQKYSPGDLHRQVIERNAIFDLGRTTAGGQ